MEISPEPKCGAVLFSMRTTLGRNENKAKLRRGSFAAKGCGRPGELHLVAAEVIVGQTLEPFAQLFAGGLLVDGARDLGAFQHGFLDVDGAIDAQCQSESVAGPRINGHMLT